MPQIVFLPHPEICPEGALILAESGESVCEAALRQGVDIEHACGCACACTTCHVVVREGFDSLSDMDDLEADLLDQAWGLEVESRLSCQARVSNQDLVVEIPRYSINHAKEAN